LEYHQISKTQINPNDIHNDNNNDNNYDIENKEFSTHEIMCYKIWLHAFSYKFDKYEFETKRPYWSLEDYEMDYKF